MSTLIVCGIMIGYICNAATEFIVTFADDSDIVNLHNWSQGSFSGTTMGYSGFRGAGGYCCDAATIQAMTLKTDILCCGFVIGNEE